MKKLIALVFCLAVLATIARAEYPQNSGTKKVYTPQTRQMGEMGARLDQKVMKEQRKVTLRVYAASDPREYAEGKAVIMGVQKGNIVLLTTQALANDINILGDESYLAQIVGDKKPVSKVIDIRSVHQQGTVLHYQVTLPAGSFKNLKLEMLTATQAMQLL